ncbi:RNA polymerase II transcription factor B subunit 5 [Venturia nashicola]|uniref:General transcription and DNA repair factor IIH subunit TFB5 n=1 Tax=Venturia nashicola TaxID=86259 RepID=A0A4Z1NLE4_9PEZI|nr:RNA polymerase II transcription factor B subunit 5 [Venturia nashicola]TLD24561.1 RNA polymerase II transcription factor B subunit 5 [Venturia nashicola]
MVKGQPGILVTADESIMAIIKKINEQNGHRYILEDLGDKNCLIKDGTLHALESEVKRIIKEKAPDPKDSDDEA